MKKVLIWDMFPLANVGGPAGYLYNVREYLMENPNSQITFLSDYVKQELGKVAWYEDRPHANLERRTCLHQIYYQFNKAYCMCLMPFWKIEFPYLANLDINQFDYVHIHIITHVSQFRRLFPNYKGKVILTIHCPCTWTEEILSYTASEKSKLSKITKRIRPLVLREECKAYKSADFIMFPCSGAKEPYFKDPKVRQVFEEVNQKFFYVPTSIVDYAPDRSKMQTYSDLGIPNNAFVITYFGRHIPVKGYDILCQVGVELLNKNPNLYVLCAGKGNVGAPNHPRWKELGFVNNVDDLLCQSNLYILPNRETYFDLITLQILRAGVPLMLSSTGGNNYFKELPSTETHGLVFFDVNNPTQIMEEALSIIEMRSENKKDYIAMGKANRELFENYFTMNHYIEKYTAAIEKL